MSVKRVSALAKRLLQSAHNAPPNFACAVLFMVSEVSPREQRVLKKGQGEKTSSVKCERLA